jgi:CRP/FNR family transcriptional regulator, cyclic AMP receptor protein
MADMREHSDFDPQTFLHSAGVARKIVEFKRKETIFSQGDACNSIMYIQKGCVQLSVVSEAGKAAVVAVLWRGDFLGEEGLAERPLCIATATAVTPTTVLKIGKSEMLRVLHAEHALSDRFINYTLRRSIRIQEDLIDQLFNSSEKRLARTLLLLGRYGTEDKPQGVIPKMSQETLAEMVGTSRSRVSIFMNRFRKLGLIEYKGEIHINSSLLRGILHDHL